MSGAAPPYPLQASATRLPVETITSKIITSDSSSMMTSSTNGNQTSLEILHMAAQRLPLADTPRHSERSSSMDADGTETGSESELMTIETKTSVGDLFGPRNPHSDNMNGNITIASVQHHLDPTADQPQLSSRSGSQGQKTRLTFPPPQDQEQQKLPIRPNAEECLFYIHTGWCGYGSQCRYNHPPEKMVLYKPKAFNSLGFPLRENVADCAYFLRTGICKFGSTCKFNHPQKVIDEWPQQATSSANPSAASSPALSPTAMASLPMMGNQSVQVLGTPQFPPPQQPSPSRRGRSPSGQPLSPTSGGLFPPGPMTMYNQPSSSVGFPAAAPAGAMTYPGQPYIVYYVPQTPDNRCWSFLTTGRCQLGHQCPYLHS
jgi:hypothetical protein